MTLGTLLFLPFSGVLASELGWEWMFYIEGIITAIWYILWLIFVFDSPEIHPMITTQERNFILSSLGTSVGVSASNEPVSIKLFILSEIYVSFMYSYMDFSKIFYSFDMFQNH